MPSRSSDKPDDPEFLCDRIILEQLRHSAAEAREAIMRSRKTLDEAHRLLDLARLLESHYTGPKFRE
jgi:hypothetical protein